MGNAPHVLRNVLAVGFGDDRVFIEDIVHELRCDSDFGFAAWHGLRTRVHKLARLALALTLCGRLCKDEVLYIPDSER